MSKLISPYKYLVPDIGSRRQADEAAKTYAASPLTPYLIAAAFVSLTALLVLLLTALLDKKASLEQVIVTQDKSHILAEARVVFGQSGMHSVTAETLATTDKGAGTSSPASNTPSSAQHRSQEESLEEFITRPIDIDEPVAQADARNNLNNPDMSAPAATRPTDHPVLPHRLLWPVDEPAFVRVASTRGEIINDLRVSYTGQVVDRQELGYMVNQHLGEMDYRHRDLDSRRRSSITPAASAYNKINFRRHSAFGRLSQKAVKNQRHLQERQRRLGQDHT